MTKKTMKYIGGALILLVIIVSVFVLYNREYQGFENINLTDPSSLELTDHLAVGADDGNIVRIDDKKHNLRSGPVRDLAAVDSFIYILDEDLEIYDDNGKARQTVSLSDYDFDTIRAENNTVTGIGEKTIATFDNDGNVLAEDEIEEGMFVSSAVAKKRNYFAYASLKVEDNRYISELSFRDSQGVVFNHQLVDRVIYDMGFTENDLFVLTDRGIFKFTPENGVRSVFSEEPKAFCVTEDRILLIDGDSFVVYDEDLNRLDKISMSRDYDRIIASGQDIVLYGEGGYGSYRTNRITDFKTGEPIQKVLANRYGIYMVFSNKLQKIK